jgi:calcium binding protein 39
MGSFFFVIPQVFVANPNKPRSIIEALIENRRELLKLLQNLPTSKGSRGA